MRAKKIIDLSVIIINYNGEKYASRCIDSVLISKTPNTEIVVVDNGSHHDVARLRKRYKNKIKLVALDKNYGPAKARNEGVRISKGNYIAFLDNDTLVHKDWARNALQEFDKDNQLGIIQCKLLLAKNKKRIDYVGEYIGSNGFLIQRAKTGEIDRHQYDKRSKILAAKSAGMFIRRAVFDEIGGFDNDYFIYVEETDLGWRSWLRGYKAIFVPKSIVYHEFGTSTVILGKSKNNYNAKFHGSKNYILTLFKNLGPVSLIKIIPLHVLLWEGLALYQLMKGEFKNFIWINQGILWNLLNLKDSFKKRHNIQKTRVVSDKELFKIILKKKPFSYFLIKATHKQRIGNAESF